MLYKLRQRVGRLVPRNTFVRGVLAMVGGAVGTQAIMIAASPILTRIYTPEMFGLAAVFVGFTAIFGTLATWRYELAIPQAENDQAAGNLALLCFALSLCLFVATSLALLFFKVELAALFNLDAIADLLWLIPVYVLTIGISQILTYWHYRKKQFSAVAKAAVSRNAGMVVLQLIFYPFGAAALVTGQFFGQLVSIGTLLCGSAKLFRQKKDVAVIKANARRFRKYPIFSTWSGLTGGAAQQAPTLMFAALFSPVQAGLYSLAFRMVSLPGALVGSAVANVFLPHAADAYREGKLGDLLLKVHSILVPIAIPAVVVLVLLSPALFAFVFGSEWREAGSYAQWLAVMLYANFIFGPVSTSFGIMNKQDAGLLLYVSLLVASLTSIWIGATFFQDTLATIALYSIANAMLYFLALIWLHLQVGSTVVALLKPLACSFLRAIPMALPLLLVVNLTLPLWSVSILVAISIFFTFLYYLPLLKQLRQSKGDNLQEPVLP
ncbi:oligosaccharide flippase family protein [Stutzerimonas nitrititolerans]|uniref:oligosaccharide flippase family protein n=1 Tax=Stutzerimonas nitrititolerans TaxID=2482751 RepID=UPI0028AA9FAA|nr:oligosaccharide flippase family protein [Stutzerimonas nitrititolerans]